VGSCVGQKGVRVQAIISELFGEKIDIIPFSASIEKYIAAALSPARVTGVEIIEDENRAVVSVPEDQQSLAIGREGQNARLANKLTKWKIDIKGTKGVFDTTEDTSSQSTENRDVVGVWDAAIEKVNKQLEDSAKTTEEKIQENTESEKTESTQ
ncbi:MAG TPA: transcription termination/antitermination protein NusA, partial [bacterium]|nr:transcription termination/antitermination protein NusA [bacterium]